MKRGLQRFFLYPTLQRVLDTNIPVRLPPLTLEPLKSARIIHDVDTHPLCLNLPNGPLEPPACPQEPAAERPERDDTDGNRCVIQRLAIDRVLLWQAKDNGDEGDVQTCDSGDGSGQGAEIERTLFEIGVIDETDEDREAVGDVEADGGDGGGGREGDGGAKRWDREEEREKGRQADCPDRSLVFGGDRREEGR